MTVVASTSQNASRPTRSGGVWTFLPAHRKDGSVRAWTLLDCADYESAQEFRWSLSSAGYFVRMKRGADRAISLLHREILGLLPGDQREGDHVNHDKLDNRRLNLRVVDSQGNKQNASRRKDTTHGRGVAFHQGRRKPWQARVQSMGKVTSFGYYQTREEAAAAARQGRELLLPLATD